MRLRSIIPSPPGRVLWSVAVLVVLSAASASGGSRVDIPKPTDRLQPPPPAPAVAPSVANLEVILPAEELADAADQSFPAVAAREDGWNDAQTLPGRDDLRYLYRLVRGSFTYRMDQDRFEMRFDQIRYRMWVRQGEADSAVDSRCGHGDDPPKQLRVIARSQLSWSDRWRLQSKTTIEPAEFLQPCRLPEINVDGTALVRSVLEPKLTSLADTIDRTIRERTESRQRAETIWRKLQEPVELSPGQWLLFNPRNMRVSPIHSHGTLLLRTSVNLVMEPQVKQSARPSVTETPLPLLQLSPATLEGFHLTLPMRTDYGRINRRLTQLMVGQVIETTPGEPLTITGVELYGSGNKLILALRVTGGFNGTLYAAGIPVFDEASRAVRFVDLDFTVDTRDVLVNAINRFGHETLLERLRSEARIDLAEPMDRLQMRLNEALTRDLALGIRLEGGISKLRPHRIYPVESGVEVQLVADGFMRLSLR